MSKVKWLSFNFHRRYCFLYFYYRNCLVTIKKSLCYYPAQMCPNHRLFASIILFSFVLPAVNLRWSFSLYWLSLYQVLFNFMNEWLLLLLLLLLCDYCDLTRTKKIIDPKSGLLIDGENKNYFYILQNHMSLL